MKPEKQKIKYQQIEQNFLNAIQRLAEGKPTNKKLKIKLKNSGKLSLNASNVALEAGHSRTLIALEDSKYPRVREALKLTSNIETTNPSTYSQLINNLRSDLLLEKTQNRLLQSEIANHFIARKKAEEDVIRAEKIVSQLRKELNELRKLNSIILK